MKNRCRTHLPTSTFASRWGAPATSSFTPPSQNCITTNRPAGAATSRQRRPRAFANAGPVFWSAVLITIQIFLAHQRISQCAAARMFAQSAKGFHVHPPSIPPETSAEKWQRRLFVTDPQNYSLRPYNDEQWDVMFFVQGRAEMILRDVRSGLPGRIMRFFVDGDNHRSANNVGIVVPPGVAHAIRVEGSEDVIMVYGTSTIFRPEFEGRIASEIETVPLPDSWQTFLSL